LCRKRAVFSDAELSEQWRYRRNNPPFIVNFLYAYSLPKKPNMKKLIEMGVIADIKSAPRGFMTITKKNVTDILRASQTDANIAVD